MGSKEAETYRCIVCTLVSEAYKFLVRTRSLLLEFVHILVASLVLKRVLLLNRVLVLLLFFMPIYKWCHKLCMSLEFIVSFASVN